MESLLSTASHAPRLRALLRWPPLVVAGSLLVACEGVENQPPFATVDTLPAIEIMTEKSRQVYDAGDYFRDPDQDPLSFTASIDDATVATAVVTDSRLVIEGLTGGETMVTLTATDSHGGEAQVSGQILVVEPVLLWRDDFDFPTGEWDVDDSDYDHRPGYLSIRDAMARRIDDDNAMDWLMSTSVAVEEGSTNQGAGLWSYTPSMLIACKTINFMSAHLRWVDDIGPTPGSNWRIMYYNCYPYKVAAYGNSDGVAPVGEFSEMHWGVRLGRMEFFVGETLVFSQEAAEGPTGNGDVENGWPLVHYTSLLFGYGIGDETGQWVYFDWAELWGVPVEEGEVDLSGDWRLQEGSVSLISMPPAMFRDADFTEQ